MKNQKWIRKGLAMLLTIAMVVGLMPGAGTIKVSAAESEASVASTISYLDESGNIKTCESATLVTSEDTAWGTSGNDTWYVVNGDVTIGSADTVQRVTVNGNVHLILTDGCNLIVNGGIGVGLDSSLTIYGQTAGTGALEARNVGDRNAGIGGGYGGNFSGGAITINGGTITATGGYAGAGIGGGGVSASGYLYDKGGPIIINGGTINANGGLNGAGIGDGKKGAGGRTITINGGTINAIGKDYAAGIGSGSDGSSGGTDNGSIIINISGGSITATGGYKGAGIGGGSSDKGGVTINISGGTINATGGSKDNSGTEYAAGIGEGYYPKKNISVSITNGVVMASSISDTSNQESWNGVVFQGNAGKAYGTSLDIATDCTIPSGKTLEVAAGQTVSIDDVTNFVNNGVICNSGTITGMVTNNGTIHNTGTISGASGGTINHYSIEPIEINVCKLAVLTLKVNNTNTFDETVTYALSAEESNAIIENGITLKVTNQDVIGSAIPVTATFTINGVTMTRTENVTITGHNYGTNGFCTICNGYQPATLTTDKHDINDDGTKDEVYEIINAGQLYWFADKVNSENSTYGSANAILMDNITVNENVLVNGDLNTALTNSRSWTPIGNNSSQYTGTFDGNHKTISGLYLSDTSTNFIGLFGYVGSGGKICNVGVVDSYFNGKYSVSGVCGHNYGTITSCYNTSRIICNQYEAGGVCASNFGVIENCYNAGEISGIGGNESNFGGVCARNLGITRKSYNTGRVSGTGHIFGGVCGNNYAYTNSAIIENCYNTGEVSGTAAVSENFQTSIEEIAIGGVCGYNYAYTELALIKNCYNIGNISGTASNADKVMKGSVCGSSDKGTINNCYFLTGTGNAALGGDSNSSVEDVLEKGDNQFASGEVAWLLNGKKSEGTEANPLVWYQNINEETADASPTFDTSHEIVYASEPCPIEYTNTSAKKIEHTYFLNTEDKTKHICEKCAYSAAHSTEKLSYEADDVNDTIAVICGECNVVLGTVTLSAPAVDTLTYDNSAKAATVTSEVQCTGFTNPSITYKKGDTALDSAPKDAGEYTASITLGTGTGAATVSVEFTIEKTTPTLGDVSVAALSDTLDASQAAFSRTNEAVAGTFALKEVTELQYGTHDYTYIFTPTGDDAVNYVPVEGTVSITVNDTVCPEATIKIKDTTWKSILNVLTFGNFFKATKDIDVEASDGGTGVAGTWYYVSENLLSEEAVKALEDSKWEAYDSSNKPSLSKGSCYVYVKVTDNADNTTYVGTDGIVIYEDSTAVSTDIAYTYKENADKSVSLALNGNTVKEITDKIGNPLTTGTDYTVAEDGTITFKASYLDILNASETAYPFTVSYKPQGETYVKNQDEEGSDLNEAPDTTTINVLVSKADGSVTDISDLSKTYDGKAVSAPTFTSTNDKGESNVTIEYKLASDEDSAYDTTAPKDAGQYLVRVTVAADENYKEASAKKEFTISPMSIEGAVITLGESLTFTGEEQTQKVGSVKVGNAENQLILTASDYELTGATQTNAGDYTLTVTGMGNFTGSATKDFSIAKAEAPVIAAVKKNYCYTAGSAGNTVTIDINASLPADKGNTTYVLAQNDAAFVIDKAVSEDGKLTYKVGTQESSGASTTLTVTASSDNYKDITVNVIIGIVDKFVPAEKEDAKVAIVGSNELTYGQKLSTLTLNNDVAVFVEKNDTTKTISGTLDWTTPDAVLAVGTTAAEWTFTPSDSSIYETLTGKLAIKVNKAEPKVEVLPTVADKIYHPATKLADTDLILTEASVLDVNGQKLSGTWNWKTAAVIPTVNNSGYEAVFTPADTANYNTITKTITVNVAKATPYIKEAPTADAITYGKTLADATLTGGSIQYSSEDTTAVDGTFAWKVDTTKPAVADSDKTAYKVVFTPTNKNYNTVEKDITVTVSKADAAPNKPDNTMDVDYGKEKVSDITTLPEGWAWQDADKDTALTVGTPVAATAVYTGADKGNYETESVEISITRLECTHVTTEVKNEKDATCTEKGYTGDTYCKVCGEKVETGQDIDALGHSFAAEFTVDVVPTCAAAGSKSRHCTRCDEVTDVTPIDKLTTHSYVNGVCSVCDDIFKTTVDGVTYQVMTETGADGKPVGKLVTVSGNEIPQVAVAVTRTGDDFAVSDGKVTVPSEITGSGSEQTFVVTKLSENAFSGVSVTEVVVPATVTEVGTGAFGTASTITFKGNTAPSGIAGAITETVTTVNVPEGAADSYRDALGEKANIVEVHTHTFDTKWTYDDTYHWHAATCGHETEVSDKAVHTFGEWTVTKEATEDAEGVKERSCSCGYKETAKIDKLAHTIHVKDEGTRVEPTCEKKGSITYKCTKCGEVMEVVELAATGHKWDAGKVTKAATETAEGVKTYTCSVCGKTKTEAIPKKTATTQEPPKKGDVVADDKTSVKVEVSDVKKKEVEYKEPANKKAKTVSIPATVKINGVTYKVTKIADNAFKNNKTVTKVTVGSNITTIGKNAFYKCTKFKTVKIGKNVTTIGSNAFKGCTSLTSVTLPSKATKIGANAFSGCKKVKTIKITSTKLTSKTVSKNAFKGLTKATTIKVPKKKLSAYKKLFKQKGLSSKVKVKGY